MSNLGNVVGAVVGFAVIRRILNTQPTAVTPTPAPAPVIPTIGPAGPSVKDYKLIPESFTQGQNQGSGLTFSPITIKTLETFDPTKKVTIPTYDPGVPVAKPIKEGKIKKFGSGINFGI